MRLFTRQVSGVKRSSGLIILSYSCALVSPCLKGDLYAVGWVLACSICIIQLTLESAAKSSEKKSNVQGGLKQIMAQAPVFSKSCQMYFYEPLSHLNANYGKLAICTKSVKVKPASFIPLSSFVFVVDVFKGKG